MPDFPTLDALGRFLAVFVWFFLVVFGAGLSITSRIMKTTESTVSFPWLLKKPKPRGLWVGKKRTPAATWKDSAVPEYFTNFYFRYQRVGRPQLFRAIDDVNVTTLKQAQEKAWLEISALDAQRTETLRSALAGIRTIRAGMPWKDFEAAFTKVAAQREIDGTRPLNDLRRMMAISKGWLAPLANTRMGANGGELTKRVQTELTTDDICEEAVREYARLMQVAFLKAEAGDDHASVPENQALNLSTKSPLAINHTINQCLSNSRVPFSEANKAAGMDKLPLDWQRIEGFCKLMMPVAGRDVAEDIPSNEAVAAMMADWLRLKQSSDVADLELALVNEVFRVTGMRSIEMCHARESWILQHEGRWWLDLRHRPDEGWFCKTNTAGWLPLGDDLAGRLKARCEAARAKGIKNPHLILPEAGEEITKKPSGRLEAEEVLPRQFLIRSRHNEWLKGHIGEIKSGQGNHRLRKLTASALFVKLTVEDGMDEATAERRVAQYLRHSKAAKALCSYLVKRKDHLPVMTDSDLAGWRTRTAETVKKAA